MRPSFQRQSADSAGFSLLEMLVVVGILGIVAVFGIPSLLQQLSRLRLESTANDVANLIRQTRLRAIRDNNQYTVGVSGSNVVGMGLQGNIEWVVPAPPELPHWIGNGVIVMELDDPTARLYPGSGTADCQSKYDAGDPTPWGGESIIYDGTGVAIDAGGAGTPGTGAICLWDIGAGGDNVLQIVLQFPAGQPKVRKFLLAADSPSGADGFFERTNAVTGNSAWVWY